MSRGMSLEQIFALGPWISLLCISAVIFGSLYACAAALAARWFVRHQTPSVPVAWPDISILKPLHGAEAQLAEAIETFLNQDYDGRVQIVFGVQDPDDDAVGVVTSLIQRYPGHDLQLVVSGVLHGGNRKVSNLINIQRAARYPLLVMADSDIAVGRSYLRTIATALDQGRDGVVTCLYRGAPSGGFWSRLSAMAVHDHFLPGAILGLALGLARPCVGATIALFRETLTRIGGLEAVVDQLADDYALGDRARQAGLKVIVPPMLVSHSFEETSLRETALHELRWARTIFSVDPLGYIGSGLTHALPWALVGAALRGFDAVGWAVILIALASRLALKFWLARQFDLPEADYALTPLRDLLSFAVFFVCFWSPRASWRGTKFVIKRDGTMAAVVGSTK